MPKCQYTNDQGEAVCDYKIYMYGGHHCRQCNKFLCDIHTEGTGESKFCLRKACFPKELRTPSGRFPDVNKFENSSTPSKLEKTSSKRIQPHVKKYEVPSGPPQRTLVQLIISLVTALIALYVAVYFAYNPDTLTAVLTQIKESRIFLDTLNFLRMVSHMVDNQFEDYIPEGMKWFLSPFQIVIILGTVFTLSIGKRITYTK
jgi:hypothetical protein